MNYWKLTGQYFGYPKCCREAYEGMIFTDEQMKASDGTGFIPCQKHAKMLLAKHVVLSDLIVDRRCETVFPDSGDHLKLKLFIENKIDRTIKLALYENE